jgi:hypothetical protein
MDADGLADVLLWATMLSVAQAVGSLIVDAMRKPEPHPLDEHLRALLMLLSEELPALRDAIDEAGKNKRTRRQQ